LIFRKIIPINVKFETHELKGCGLNELNGTYYNFDISHWIESFSDKYDKSVQMIYIDPPFMTGQDYYYRQRMGGSCRQGETNSMIKHLAYKDARSSDKENYLFFMINTLKTAHRLLKDEGSIFVHVDYRLSAHVRLMMDDIFGEENFLNEIIWQYNSGGRSTKHFSRKHDNILFYRKTSNHYFNILESAVLRGRMKRNNMKKGVDDQGKVFYSIKSAGQEYRYYEDDYVNPGDVWCDISHLQQKDPERTGYDTQKPEKLLERILKVSTRPGDLIMDMFVGSGTLPAVAQKHGRNWVGIDSSIFSLHVSRKRLINIKNVEERFKLTFCLNDEFLDHRKENDPKIEYFMLENGQIEIRLIRYIPDFPHELVSPNKLQNGVGLIDYWAVGYIVEGTFETSSSEARTSKHPDLFGVLKLEPIEGKTACIQMIDVFGRQQFCMIHL